MQWIDLPNFRLVCHWVTAPVYQRVLGILYHLLMRSNINLIKGQEVCTQGSIRLQGGTNTSGCVEVCHINVWGTVCGDSYWGITGAQVACRQLGLPTTGATTHILYDVPDATRVSWLVNRRCVGTESSLFNCSAHITEGNCYRSRYAGVSCQDSKS